jgi:hypothetical protein
MSWRMVRSMWVYDVFEKVFEEVMSLLFIGGMAASYVLIIGYIVREAWRLVRKRRNASDGR